MEEQEQQRQGQWLNLTNDVLALILKRLQTKADVCRFRSVCKQWRSFASPLKPHLLFPLSLPPIDPNFRPFSVSPTLLYLLSPPNSNHVWLVKVSETGDNRWPLLNPLTNDKLSFPSGVFHPRMINLLGFNNSEVGRSYRLQSVGDLGENNFDLGDYSSSVDVKKVAVKITLDELVVVVLNGFSGKWGMSSRLGQILVWKLGDEKWNVVEKENHFNDVICYEGVFYAVDRRGRLAVIDTTSFKADDVVAPMEDCEGHYPYLVESNFGLYFVNKVVSLSIDNYYGEDKEDWVLRTSVYKPTAIKVFVFNNGREKGWEKVDSLGDRVFFVTRDAAFSVRAEDLGWSKGNCIYFEGLPAYGDEVDMGFGVNAGVYSLDDQVISTFGSLADPRTKNFWPPSSWFVRVEDYLEY